MALRRPHEGMKIGPRNTLSGGPAPALHFHNPSGLNSGVRRMVGYGGYFHSKDEFGSWTDDSGVIFVPIIHAGRGRHTKE